MHDLLLLTALLVAVATGWWLGRRERKRRANPGLALPEGYLEGLDFLIREQPDESIEKFLSAIGSQGDSVDIHIALGRLFRTRGEVDKATRVHQALLARSDLEQDKLLLIQFELANDYMVAGLLDRAERLLVELSQESGGEVKWRSIELLMQIYQQEKEWDQAIASALALMPKRATEIRHLLAHYCCEKAENALRGDEVNIARKELKRALNYDPGCVRASLLRGRVETRAEHFKEAVKALRRVRDQDVSYLPEVMPELSNCYRKLGKEREFMAFLMDCLEQNPSTTLAITAAGLLQGDDKQRERAHRLIRDQLTKMPSLRGVLHLIEIYLVKSQGRPKEQEDLSELHRLTAQLVDSRPVYRCANCGYSGRRLVWLCPGCQQWGKIKPIYGADGE